MKGRNAKGRKMKGKRDRTGLTGPKIQLIFDCFETDL